MKLAVVLRHDCWLLHLLGHPISLQRSFHVPSCVRRSHCVLLQTCDPDMCSQLAVAERHCFPYGCFITFTFVCLFMLLYHGFVVPVAFITFFFFIFYALYVLPPFLLYHAFFFFSIAAFVILFVFISSNVNCCERLVKTEGACTHFVFCCSLEVLVPLCFLVVFII